jgi:hypothetical protein
MQTPLKLRPMITLRSVEPVWIAGDKARMVNLKRSGELETEVE